MHNMHRSMLNTWQG